MFSNSESQSLSYQHSPLHDIYKKDSKRATIQQENLMKMCKQCHKKANEKFIQIAVHPDLHHEESPPLFFANIALRFALYGTIFGLMGLLLLETRGCGGRLKSETGGGRKV